MTWFQSKVRGGHMCNPYSLTLITDNIDLLHRGCLLLAILSSACIWAGCGGCKLDRRVRVAPGSPCGGCSMTALSCPAPAKKLVATGVLILCCPRLALMIRHVQHGSDCSCKCVPLLLPVASCHSGSISGILLAPGLIGAEPPSTGHGVPLSSLGSIQSPRADPQKLAASWVSNQLYGDTLDQVTPSCCFETAAQG